VQKRQELEVKKRKRKAIERRIVKKTREIVLKMSFEKNWIKNVKKKKEKDKEIYIMVHLNLDILF